MSQEQKQRTSMLEVQEMLESRTSSFSVSEEGHFQLSVWSVA